jgi:hypothetical protein
MDTTAVADTLLKVVDSHTVNMVEQFMLSAFPWLDLQVINWVSHWLGAVPIVVLIFGWEIAGKYLNQLSPMLKTAIGDKLAKYSWIVNPFLGALIGGGMGDSSLGLIAGSVWSMINKSPLGTTSLVGLAKAKNVAVLLLPLLLLTATANAADLTPFKPNTSQFTDTLSPTVDTIPNKKVSIPWTSKDRFSLGIGIGNRYVDSNFNTAYTFGAVQVGYSVFNHIGLRVRVDNGNEIYNYETSAWLTF